MPSHWDNIETKDIAGKKKVNDEEKNKTISDAARMWAAMGLTQKQIAFGIAAMGLESGFDPAAKGPPKSSAYGLGQFNDKTWEDAVKKYNRLYGTTYDPDKTRKDPDSQKAVMGEWIKFIWPKAEEKSKDPELKGHSKEEIAYGLWHEGRSKDPKDLKTYLEKRENDKNGDGFNNSHNKGYFDKTYKEADDAAGKYLKDGVPITMMDMLHDPIHKSSMLDGLDPAIVYALESSEDSPLTGETLRREGDRVYRVEPDGKTRGYFLSE